MQPCGTPAKVPIFFFGTLDLRTTKVEIRGLHVLIDDKISKYHEVARFQHRSWKFKEQHIAVHGMDRTNDFVICQGEQT